MRKIHSLLLAIIAITLFVSACNGTATLSGDTDDSGWGNPRTESVSETETQDVPSQECTDDEQCRNGMACIRNQCVTVYGGDTDTVDTAEQSDNEQATGIPCETSQYCLDHLEVGDCQLAVCSNTGQCHIVYDSRCEEGDTDTDATESEPDAEPNVCICDPDLDPCTRDYCDAYGACRHDQIADCWTCTSNSQCENIADCQSGDRIFTHPDNAQCEYVEGHGTGRCQLYLEDCGMLGCYDGQCVQSDEGDIDLDSYDETEQEDEEGEIVCTQEQRICLDGSNAEPVEGTCNQFCPEDTYRWCSEDFCRPCQDNHRCQADVVICENDRDRLIHLEGVCELGYCTYHVESCGGYGCGEYRDETMCFNHSQPDGDEDNLGDYAVDELPYDPDGVWCMFSGCPGGQQAIYWWGGRNGDETRVDCGQAFFLSYEGVCGWSSNEFHFNSTSYTALLTVTCNPEVTVDTIDGLEGTTKRRATVPYACF